MENIENGKKQKSTDDIYLTDWSTLHEKGDFSQQAEVLLRTVRMPRATAQQFRRLLDDLRHQLLKIWPDFEITTFGSTATGLALRSSDIDVYITFRTITTNIDTEQRLVTQAAEILRKNSVFTNVNTQYIPIPMLIFTHVPTRQKCDAKLRIDHNDKETRIINYFIGLDSRVLSLMIIIKYWSNLHGLVIKHRMPNIVWTSLVIFYLQQVDILPSVYSLQKSVEPKMEHHWNYNFEKSFEYLYYPENNDTLYKLLGGFFNYYANFDFENNVISIFAGIAVPRNMFSDIEKLPEIFELYKSNVRNNVINPLEIDGALCLHRLFEHNRNIADEKIPQVQYAAIISYLKKAYETYRKSDEKYFLQDILTI